jgi:hypothetical protein
MMQTKTESARPTFSGLRIEGIRGTHRRSLTVLLTLPFICA